MASRIEAMAPRYSRLPKIISKVVADAVCLEHGTTLDQLENEVGKLCRSDNVQLVNLLESLGY